MDQRVKLAALRERVKTVEAGVRLRREAGSTT